MEKWTYFVALVIKSDDFSEKYLKDSTKRMLIIILIALIKIIQKTSYSTDTILTLGRNPEKFYWRCMNNL